MLKTLGFNYIVIYISETTIYSCYSLIYFIETPLRGLNIQKEREFENSSFTRRPSESSMYGHRKQSTANEVE